ncbi:hypothetical protein Dimus_024973, partial [Dionaea muscipula]
MIAEGGADSSGRCRDPRKRGGWLPSLIRTVGGGDLRGPPRWLVALAAGGGGGTRRLGLLQTLMRLR